jgi:hypothetical protein
MAAAASAFSLPLLPMAADPVSEFAGHRARRMIHSLLSRAVLAGVLAAGTLVPPIIAGADEAAERARICHPGFARAGRPSEAEWQRLKAAALARAGLPWSQRNDFELDHIVPRCLDGSNDLANLQLQPWPEAEEKDHREAETCRAYCSGEISLEQARSSFHREWP